MTPAVSLCCPGVVDSNETAWRETLTDFWFGRYSRSNVNDELDSCGFEHVFQGQIQETRVDVVGFHNWVQVYQEEQRESFVYSEGYADCGVSVYSEGYADCGESSSFLCPFPLTFDDLLKFLHVPMLQNKLLFYVPGVRIH